MLRVFEYLRQGEYSIMLAVVLRFHDRESRHLAKRIPSICEALVGGIDPWWNSSFFLHFLSLVEQAKTQLWSQGPTGIGDQRQQRNITRAGL